MKTLRLALTCVTTIMSAVQLEAQVVGRLTNLSTRLYMEDTNNQPKLPIVGFNVSGGPKTLLLRAIGPSLSMFDVPNFEASADGPQAHVGTFFKVYLNNQTFVRNVLPTSYQDMINMINVSYTYQDMVLAENSVGAFLPVQGNFDSVNVFTCDAALYSFIIGGTGVDPKGVVLGEVYDMDWETNPTSRLTNVSTRGWVMPNDGDTMIVGFVIEEGPLSVLIRGVGPGLTSFGVGDAVRTTTLTLYDSTGVIGYNGAWQSPVSNKGANVIALTNATEATFASVGAFNLVTGSNDSAMVVTLLPGAYTAIVGGNGQIGEGLVEVYEVPQ